MKLNVLLYILESWVKTWEYAKDKVEVWWKYKYFSTYIQYSIWKLQILFNSTTSSCLFSSTFCLIRVLQRSTFALVFRYSLWTWFTLLIYLTSTCSWCIGSATPTQNHRKVFEESIDILSSFCRYLLEIQSKLFGLCLPLFKWNFSNWI